MQVSMSLRISQELALELSALAKATGRSRVFLATEALKTFIQAEKWQVERIQQGMREADTGNFVSEKQMNELDKK